MCDTRKIITLDLLHRERERLITLSKDEVIELCMKNVLQLVNKSQLLDTATQENAELRQQLGIAKRFQ